MKKLFVLTFTLAFVIGVAVSPICAAGGKNHGAVGQGAVDQGSTGNEEASPGDDAQGYQSD